MCSLLLFIDSNPRFVSALCAFCLCDGAVQLMMTITATSTTTTTTAGGLCSCIFCFWNAKRVNWLIAGSLFHAGSAAVVFYGSTIIFQNPLSFLGSLLSNQNPFPWAMHVLLLSLPPPSECEGSN